MTTATANDSVTLNYRQNASDNIYQASIEEQNGGFVVNFAYGRRGSTLHVGTKTAQPVDYATAKKASDKLVKEKTAKGSIKEENMSADYLEFTPVGG